jgi:trypsin
VTIRPNEANLIRFLRRHAAAPLLAAFVLLGVLVLAAGATAASNPKATASVIGGHNTTVADFPSLAFIEGVQATSGYACTGTVVAPRVILTAGHCVEDIESASLVEPELIAVATGASNLTKIEATQVSEVERVLVYPNFHPSEMHGDAGLLILKAPVAAPPIALAGPEDGGLYEPGDRTTVAGWGIDDPISDHVPNQLQAATIPTASASRCKTGTAQYYPFYSPKQQLCVLDVPQFHVTICHGDSGGPAIATHSDGTPVEIGITSLGTCNPASPAVFTRVDQISSWVQSWIAAVETGGPTPRVKVPKAHIPNLMRERAEEISAIAMEEAFADKFAHGQERTIHCDRLAKARMKCGVTWFQGPNDYFGKITVFYAIRHNVVLAGVHYRINWVNDQCYFHGPDPQACRVETKTK